jgi:pyruvate dehydrogenase E1 component
MFRQSGIYAHEGQHYEPVDSDSLIYYKEAKDGQILEEGITEAGSMASFLAAATAYSTHGVNAIPFFIYYSMFGFQRIGDLIWAAGDMRARGFLVGGTSGRTTLAGEGLQHQDGHTHHLAMAYPSCVAYDPAYAYELAVIIRDGMRRMYEEQESVFYYLTVMNENYAMPAMPEGVKDGILKGMYKFKASELQDAKCHAQLFVSGSILNEVVKAQKMLEDYGVAADVWSVTSYKELRRDALECDRWNMLHAGEERRVPYVTQCLQDEKGVFVAASDYMKSLPHSISPWIPGALTALGTDGYGRSDGRAALRDFFEVDARWVTFATLHALMLDKKIKSSVVKKAMKDMGISPDKPDPLTV